jgi:mannose-6-phosphate isomerase-like protein (cupin superfamily)
MARRGSGTAVSPAVRLAVGPIIGPVETGGFAGQAAQICLRGRNKRKAAPFNRRFTMKIIRSKNFTATRPWGALDIANMGGITTRLHWTDQPYKWHVNDGEEVFAVLDGRVEMRYREAGLEQSTILETGDVFYASAGTEHVAHPIGVARILVVEAQGSV